MLEHPQVLTLGKHSNEDFILEDTPTLQKNGVEVFRTTRGGEVTAHMPGQLVVYPILPIQFWGITLRKFVNGLCRSVQETLETYGISSEYGGDNPGVWVGNNKICAMGIRVKQKTSFHGIALNISNNLSLFSKIVPCGLAEHGVTSIAKETGKSVNEKEVGMLLQTNIEKNLCLNS